VDVGLDQALDAGILPDWCFGPQPGKRFPQVLQLISASAPAEVCFSRSETGEHATRPVACYALVAQLDGETRVEPVVARQEPEIRQPITWADVHDSWHEADAASHGDQQLVLAASWAAGNRCDRWECHPQGRLSNLAEATAGPLAVLAPV